MIFSCLSQYEYLIRLLFLIIAITFNPFWVNSSDLCKVWKSGIKQDIVCIQTCMVGSIQQSHHCFCFFCLSKLTITAILQCKEFYTAINCLNMNVSTKKKCLVSNRFITAVSNIENRSLRNPISLGYTQKLCAYYTTIRFEWIYYTKHKKLNWILREVLFYLFKWLS